MDMSTSCVVCGTKSQDYTIECYCCGNYYCSDKCKVQDHQKSFSNIIAGRSIEKSTKRS